MTPLWILLLLQLPLTREQAIYARKGHPQELPCGLDKALLGAEELIWSYNGGGNQQSKMLFRVMADRPPKRQPDAWDNLSVLRNHSLYLRVAEDSDTGTYWCTAPGANQHYYDGSQAVSLPTFISDPPGPKWQLYENVGLGQPPPDGAGTMPGSLPP
uniref:Ig-like domain-containing protein n=1 Tax=Pelusios castaneus TaxID=367368 RepID=A0A8C8RFL2_9SAUR